MWDKSSCVTVFLFVILVSVKKSLQESLENELTLTNKQAQKLFEFRDLVSSKLPHDYMKTDIYLVRWLRARDFNVQSAKTMLMENIQWRKENDMDNVLKEDWSDFEREYRFGIEGCDKEGRPVVSVYVGDWDVRKAVLAGQGRKMMRYFDKLMEQVTTIIRHAQDHGENVTQYNHIFEMGNYNLVIQGCPNCIPIYLHLFRSYQSHYPGFVNKIYMINTPTVFQALWQIITPILHRRTRDIIHIYGRDKKEWQKALSEDIERRMLTKDFGGTKDNPLELEELLDDGYFQCSKY